MSDQAAQPTELERAIGSQPAELRRLLGVPIQHDMIERLRQAHRIWLVGTGTSQHAAELAPRCSTTPDARRTRCPRCGS